MLHMKSILYNIYMGIPKQIIIKKSLKANGYRQFVNKLLLLMENFILIL